MGPSNLSSVLFMQLYVENFVKLLDIKQSVTVNWISASQFIFTSCHCVDGTCPPVFCIWLSHHRRARYVCTILPVHQYSTPNICLSLHRGIWSHFAINNVLFLEICICLRRALWFCLETLKSAFFESVCCY